MLLVVRYGGVLLIDEINLVHQRITAGFHQLLSVNRRISVTEHRETVRGGRGGLGTPQPLLLAAAFNDGRYEGTVRLNQALRNRYAMPIRWRYDRNVEEQLIPSERLLDMADNMRNMESVRTPVSTNALQEFVRHARGLDMRAAVGFFLDRFDDDERNSVSLALEAESAAIASELGVENIVFVHESVGDDDDE
jgi:MoxR-like ATPase